MEPRGFARWSNLFDLGPETLAVIDRLEMGGLMKKGMSATRAWEQYAGEAEYSLDFNLGNRGRPPEPQPG